jgi:catechol 2,3-dioxygenase-like lactoylglutathione lyase family enzyme
MAAYRHEHIHLTTKDPRKTAKFYSEVMGAKVTKEENINGNLRIDIDLGGIPIRISSITGWGPELGMHHVGLFVDNMDKAVAELKSAGVEFVREPSSSQSGLKVAFIKTPDGVLIELMEKK